MSTNGDHLVPVPIESADGGKDSQMMTLQEQQCLTQITDWIQNEAYFNQNIDNEFLLGFICGCKFDVEKTKRMLRAHYEVRRKFPQWWTNRNVREPTVLTYLQPSGTVVLTSRNVENPVLVITRLCCLLQNLRNIDIYVMLQSVIVEFVARNRSSQKNGAIWLMDCQNYPLWFLRYALSPFFMRDLTNNLLSVVVKLVSVHVINCPAVTVGVWPLVKPFLKAKIANRVYFYRSEWPTLFDHVPIDMVPKDYGGNGHSMATHIDEFLKEILAFSDKYILTEDKF